MEEPTQRSIASFLAASASEGGRSRQVRQRALNESLTQERWTLLFNAALSVLKRPGAREDLYREVAAEAVVAYVMALARTDVNPSRAPGYFRSIVKNQFATALEQRSQRATPLDPERLGEVVVDDLQADDLHADYAAETWERITDAAYDARDLAAEAILTAAWDLASEGQKVKKSAVARRSGYNRTTVHGVLDYARHYVDEGVDEWLRPHR